MDLVLGLKWYLIFLFSTVCHEAAHAFVALKLGDSTAAEGGQVSLDPWPHLRREPIGMVVVPLLTLLTSGSLFGWASAPLNPLWARANPRSYALVAIAGPLANLVLMGVATLLMLVGLSQGLVDLPTISSYGYLVVPGLHEWSLFYSSVVNILFSMNLLLFVLNLLPVPPLDGSRIPLLFIPEKWASGYFDSVLGNRGFAWIGLIVMMNFFSIIFKPISQE
ncbi:MAG: site-2 protease family protein, partial [Verrucomicrobiota bacterium]